MRPTNHALTLILVAGLATPAAAQKAPAARPDSKAAVSLPRPAEKPVWPDEGPATWAPRPTVTAITANDLRTRLYQFADDSMMGRRIGEPGNYKGTEYIASEFKRLGLRPMGDNGTYFQVLRYGPTGFDSTKGRFTIAGEAAGLKTDWVPVAPTTANGFSGVADFTDVPAVFAGRWGDTTIALDPAVFAGKVAVFISTPTAAGLSQRTRGPAPVESCDSLPDMFGAQAAAIQEAADRRAGRPPRRGGGNVRDTRWQALGAKAVLFITLDNTTPSSIDSAFRIRMGMEAPTTGVPAAAVSQSVGRRIFGTIDMLVVGAPGKPVSAQWSREFQLAASPARTTTTWA